MDQNWHSNILNDRDGSGMFRWQSAFFLALIFRLAPALAQEGSVAKLAMVPFVGCPSDGQAGPLPASTAAVNVQVDPSVASKLAYYKSETGPGVLAPKGWYCFGTYGSAGSHLFVAPQPIPAQSLFSSNWHGFTGAAIQADNVSGGTSGRFEVARVIARVFPTYQKFVRQVIDEGIEPASHFPSGPYPKDQLTYKSDWMVEYRTPPHSEGLGTNSHLQKNDDSIDGVIILQGPETYLLKLTQRLSADLYGLESPIRARFEKEWGSRPQ
jgi:hypothetical protein